MNAQMIEEKAKSKLKNLETKILVEFYEWLDTIKDMDISMVRGWIMDELENRNQSNFYQWIDSNENSPRVFFLQ